MSGIAWIALHGSKKKPSDKICQVLGKFMGTVKFVGPFGGSLRLLLCLLVGWLVGLLVGCFVGWSLFVRNASMYYFVKFDGSRSLGRTTDYV